MDSAPTLGNFLRRFRAADRSLQIAADLAVLCGALWLAYLLRFDFELTRFQLEQAALQAPLVVLLQVLAALTFGIYSFIWRFVGLAELQAFGRAALASAIPLVVCRLALPLSLQVWRVPLSIIVLDTGIAFAGLLGVRVLRRIFYERRARQTRTTASLRVLVVGAGNTGISVAREISREQGVRQIIGFIDDDRAKQGSMIQGVRVLGGGEDLEQLVPAHKIDELVLAYSASGREVRRFVALCEGLSVALKIVPPLSGILDGTVGVTKLRSVEIEDLLRREEVRLDEADLRRFLTGRRVLITGAGGSIGSELARQALRFNPASLLLVDRAEFGVFCLLRELSGRPQQAEVRPLIADVGDVPRMRDLMSRHRPQIIFHAAAHKHVPLMEVNCAEAVRNNVLATYKLGQLAVEFEVETFILVSTDKAVRPTSVMGATKRLAELLVLLLSKELRTRFLAVRFGNVMGSTGSVIPIFRQQIEEGGPVTVTHPDMVRYFMTIPEASQLVIQAGALGVGGELFALDMGEPVKILDLAKDMIRLSGFRPYDDIDIVFTGQRPGEKLFEELELASEHLRPTRHPKIFMGQLSRQLTGDLRTKVEELGQLVDLGLDREIRQGLQSLVEEAQLAETSPETLGRSAS